jgi:hypothetical protein
MHRFCSKLVRYTPTIVKTLAYYMSVIMLKVVAAFEPFKLHVVLNNWHQFIFLSFPGRQEGPGVNVLKHFRHLLKDK